MAVAASDVRAVQAFYPPDLPRVSRPAQTAEFQGTAHRGGIKSALWPPGRARSDSRVGARAAHGCFEAEHVGRRRAAHRARVDRTRPGNGGRPRVGAAAVGRRRARHAGRFGARHRPRETDAGPAVTRRPAARHRRPRAVGAPANEIAKGSGPSHEVDPVEPRRSRRRCRPRRRHRLDAPRSDTSPRAVPASISRQRRCFPRSPMSAPTASGGVTSHEWTCWNRSTERCAFAST